MYSARSNKQKKAEPERINNPFTRSGNAGLYLPAVPAFRNHPSAVAAPVIQRKILINDEHFVPKKPQHKAIENAMKDEFNRYYPDVSSMKKHLAKKEPVPFGLIKKRALWYDLKDLANTFFVLGESHAAIRGTDIEKESNLSKPVFYEGRREWSVNKFRKRGNTQMMENKGADETSSKLLQALQVFKQMLNKSKSNKHTNGKQPPPIPPGEDRTRDTRDGSYRLVIKGEDDQPEYWKSQKAPSVVSPAEYNPITEAGQAITVLFKRVFTRQFNEDSLGDYVFGLDTAWESVEYFINNPESKRDRMNQFLDIMIQATEKKIKLYYNRLIRKQGTGLLKAPDDDSLQNANDYRNEFMLHAISEVAHSGEFSFAAIGNLHLKALQNRLEAIDIPVLTLENFMSDHTRDAV